MIHDAELATVGPREAVVHFNTAAHISVTTQVGDTRTVTTTGPHHVARFFDLEPDTEYRLRVEGAEVDTHLPSAFRTLRPPAGPRVATLATVNDVHFGEEVCGYWSEDPSVGPVFRSAPGEDPYPEVMNAAAVQAIAELAPDVVVAKGDLSNEGEPENLARFREVYGGAFGNRLAYVRGNHDKTMAGEHVVHEHNGVTFAVLDTVTPGHPGGQFPSTTLGWLSEVARSTAGPVFVFGHHPTYSTDFDDGKEFPFCSTEADAVAFEATLDAHDNIVGYFCGHTHRNRVRYTPKRRVPNVEVASVKEYPGAWAEYRIHADGYVQMVHRTTDPAALAWSAQTSRMYFGMQRDFALGQLADRCFVYRY